MQKWATAIHYAYPAQLLFLFFGGGGGGGGGRALHRHNVQAPMQAPKHPALCPNQCNCGLLHSITPMRQSLTSADAQSGAVQETHKLAANHKPVGSWSACVPQDLATPALPRRMRFTVPLTGATVCTPCMSKPTCALRYAATGALHRPPALDRSMSSHLLHILNRTRMAAVTQA